MYSSKGLTILAHDLFTVINKQKKNIPLQKQLPKTQYGVSLVSQ